MSWNGFIKCKLQRGAQQLSGSCFYCPGYKLWIFLPGIDTWIYILVPKRSCSKKPIWFTSKRVRKLKEPKWLINWWLFSETIENNAIFKNRDQGQKNPQMLGLFLSWSHSTRVRVDIQWELGGEGCLLGHRADELYDGRWMSVRVVTRFVVIWMGVSVGESS